MENKLSNKTVKYIYVLGIAALTAAFFHWCINKNGYTWWGITAAAVSVALSLAIYCKFVPEWVKFWCKDNEYNKKETNKVSDAILIRIFFILCAVCICYLLVIFCIRYQKGYSQTFIDSINVWMETDADHYMDIAREWYLSEGEWDRLVQLVFLPGYPLAVKLVAVFVKNYVYAGIILSIVCFSASGCMLYKLARLDYDHKTAIRTVRYLCILPASFFFAGPMSESLFLLLCLSSLYCIRSEKWLLGCILGGYAAFTRSLGITLFVPIVMELVRDTVCSEKIKTRKIIKKSVEAIIVPLGFFIYCCINYSVSGDFLKFMEYQSQHWSQNLGWFFNTASYQTELIVSNWGENFKIIAGLWLPNVLAVFGVLVLMFFAAKKLRPSYTAWFIAYFIIAIGATWLLSAPRYLVAFAPLTMALASVTKNKTADILITFSCFVLNIAYLYVFSVRWYVW